MNETPKNNSDKGEQGHLFESEVLSLGTDPLDPKTERFTEHPEGYYSSDQPTPNPADKFADPKMLEMVKKANQEEGPNLDNEPRSVAQRGKHSARVNGEYVDVVPGKVLPGFGVVRHTNLEQARAHAAELNKKLK